MMQLFAFAMIILILQVFILYLLSKEEYKFKLFIALSMAVLMLVPIVLGGWTMRLLDTFLMGILLLLVGVMNNKKSYVYLGSLFSLMMVISSSYFVYAGIGY
ncbi:hypothetical protein [Companilactobacillus hulinensis]|uniref:hypothetical protein n=1 Tax=Companilactobacillus hulinensis TaxID=2486007 RepID=UPI000F7B847A|nr:hypothetical protein [Companilactobacillus hulinensis]